MDYYKGNSKTLCLLKALEKNGFGGYTVSDMITMVENSLLESETPFNKTLLALDDAKNR